MSGGFLNDTARNCAVAGVVALAATGYALANDNTPMTAGVVMERMEVRERYGYIAGIVEGLAYARFRKDTLAAGSKDERGMQCIYDWFYADKEAMFVRIGQAFTKYPEHFPSTLIAVMVKKECGE